MGSAEVRRREVVLNLVALRMKGIGVASEACAQSHNATSPRVLRFSELFVRTHRRHRWASSALTEANGVGFVPRSCDNAKGRTRPRRTGSDRIQHATKAGDCHRRHVRARKGQASVRRREMVAGLVAPMLASGTRSASAQA